MKKWIVPLLIIVLLLGVAANGFLNYRQAIIIQNNEVHLARLEADLQANHKVVTSLVALLSNLQADVTGTKEEVTSLSRTAQNLTVVLSTLSDSINRLSSRQIADFTSATDSVKPSVVDIKVLVETIVFPGFSIPQRASASGWVVGSDGLIVTNNHVVEDAIAIEVTLDDGRTFTSVAVESDRDTDLAVVKIDAHNLPTVKVGDSDKLQVGQPVAAIGNALGLGINLSGGWVSRLNASVTFSDGSRLTGLIGTDAAINPGSSGGPLINVDGEVIGITNAKWVETGVEGIGYAININDAIVTINSLIAKL